MKNKIIKVGPNARNEVFAGMNELTNALGVAIGPFGLNMISGIRGGAPHISNDAKEIADVFTCKDEIRDLGVRHLREAIHKANDYAGNGRKSCALLTRAIGTNIIKLLPTEKMSLGKNSLKTVIERVQNETKHAVDSLKSLSKPITTEQELINIAITASGSEELGTYIGQTQWKLGKDGSIISEDSNDGKVSIEFVKGIRIDNGFGTSVVINDPEKGTLNIQNAKLLLTNHILKSTNQIKSLLDSLYRSGTRRLIIVARGFTQEAIKECSEYQQKGYGLYVINAPYVNQGQVMLDLSAISGATYINDEARDLNDIQVSDIGFVKTLEASRWSTTFVGNDAEPIEKMVAERISTLEKELSGETSTFARNGLEIRIAQLKSGFALMKIGALSTGNRKYKKDKADDAINTVKAALQEGMVLGGGKALVEVAKLLPDTFIIKSALNAPYEQIMANAGEDFDIPEWVQDATKVVRIGLEHASEIALMAATIGIGINHELEKPRFVQESSQPNTEVV